MKIETLEVGGLLPALKAMRNPMNSWHRNDSDYMSDQTVGKNDMKLSQKLTKAGSEHCKHLRMVHVWCDMYLPRYIHSELDTYKFNTHISCSTMHKLQSRPLTVDDFQEGEVLPSTLDFLNEQITLYKHREDKAEAKRKLKMHLPESFLQLRTYDFNYAELLNIYLQRKNHKLKEWHEICDWIIELPYFKELTGIKEDD